MKINLSLIDPNPYRDFEINPINTDHVQSLADSIGDLGFWGGIACREHDGRYQLAFGHNRIEALKTLGWTEADLSVVGYNNLSMLRAMVKENALGRSSGCTSIEAVGAATRFLGEQVFFWEGLGREVRDGRRTCINEKGLQVLEEYCAPLRLKDMPRLFNKLCRFEGLGEKDYREFFDGDISVAEVRESIATLKDTGLMYRRTIQAMLDCARSNVFSAPGLALLVIAEYIDTQPATA